jgi:hypothetical protein
MYKHPSDTNMKTIANLRTIAITKSNLFRIFYVYGDKATHLNSKRYYYKYIIFVNI